MLKSGKAIDFSPVKAAADHMTAPPKLRLAGTGADP
jgi:hypothetical protein